MKRKGYYSQPTIHGDQVVFVSDDDLWSVSSTGGLANRLTRSNGTVARPVLSPDGRQIAYISVDEGYPEVHVMPAKGGPARRLTRLAAATTVLGWTPEGDRIVFATTARRPSHRLMFVYSIPAQGGPVEILPVGPAVGIAFGPEKQSVLGRGSGRDPALWKRYRGGRIGELWIDPTGDGRFKRLIETGGNLDRPIWIDQRVYFHSDHQGVGNLYSCTPGGEDLRRHTDHQDFYLRAPSGDGRRIVYTAGGELHRFDPAQDRSHRLEVDFPSQRSQRVRRFVPADRFLEGFDLDPKGSNLCLIARGKPLVMANWDGPVRQLGVPGGRVRYRLARWLSDGNRLVCVAGEGLREDLWILQAESGQAKKLEGLDLGRAVDLRVTPGRDGVVLTNHRGELIHVDLETAEQRVLDRSRFGRIAGFDISPDGRWVAYGLPRSHKCSAVQLCRLETGQIHPVAEPVLRDHSPAFDPEGKYLYFLARSSFDPVGDVLDFAYSFPMGIQLKLVTLKADLVSPFPPRTRPQDPEPEEKTGRSEPPKKVEPLEIDLEGIQRRVVPFPVPAGIHGQLLGLPGDKVLYTTRPVEGTLNQPWPAIEPEAKYTLKMYDLRKGKEEVLIQGLSRVALSGDRKTLGYLAGRKLRAVPAGKKPNEEAGKTPSPESGWIDLARPRISVEPLAEWHQMLAEGWALLRDHYYSADMAGVDWEEIYRRYAPLVERVSTRRELSDLFWELGGELGTSHAYELGGDYLPTPRYPQGFLGADFRCSGEGWLLDRIIQGDPGEPGRDSPLNGPGIDVQPGDELLAVNGIPVTPEQPPEELLVNLGGTPVSLTFRRNGQTRTFTITALRGEMFPRHREWVRECTRRVHEASDGRVGYVHIPDMGARGFSEFHRAFLVEVQRQGLIVDVRGNAGGHVSPLILARLMRRRTGYGMGRWSEPVPKPPDSFQGPIVGLTDEFSGSDGDIFSHNFKQLGVGPLIGRRTWGGIVGLNPTHPLVDGTVTTQPEFYNWFPDVGFNLEGRGAVPDIEVEIPPQDYAAGRDPQLERAIQVALELLAENPPEDPDFGPFPDRRVPELPER